MLTLTKLQRYVIPGANVPNLLHLTDIQDFGADGITVHLRPDERHIKYDDVHELKQLLIPNSILRLPNKVY